MKLVSKFLLAASSVLYAHSAIAAGTFGVVNMQKVILNVQEGKTARAALEAQIKTKEADLGAKKKELDKMNEEWKTQAPLLSEEARVKKQEAFQKKFMELQQEERQFQGEIKQKESEATQKIAMKVAEMVDNMAKAKKLDAVFETNSSGLLYLNSPVDLTDEVIKEYDKAKK